MIAAGLLSAAERRHEDREVLERLAGELEDLARRADAAGRAEGPSLRADATVLRRIAAGLAATITVASTPYDGPLTTVSTDRPSDPCSA